MFEKYRGTGWKKPYLIYGMCDESFSINYTAKIPQNIDAGWFMFFVTLLNQIYWVAGATIGGLVGANLPINTEGIEFAMTALFVVIFGRDAFMIPSMLIILTGCLAARPFIEGRTTA